MDYKNDQSFAREMDRRDPLAAFRDRFVFPEPGKNRVIYFCGNSLGLQPKDTGKYVMQELEDWQRLAVRGHMEARNPWVSYEKLFQEPLAAIVGARSCEVVAMNSLTVNMHLLLASFYRPTKKRYKIIIDGDTFPSDS
jgi:kynureninase